jgi:hypothetical protein
MLKTNRPRQTLWSLFGFFFAGGRTITGFFFSAAVNGGGFRSALGGFLRLCKQAKVNKQGAYDARYAFQPESGKVTSSQAIFSCTVSDPRSAETCSADGRSSLCLGKLCLIGRGLEER